MLLGAAREHRHSSLGNYAAAPAGRVRLSEAQGEAHGTGPRELLTALLSCLLSLEQGQACAEAGLPKTHSREKSGAPAAPARIQSCKWAVFFGTEAREAVSTVPLAYSSGKWTVTQEAGTAWESAGSRSSERAVGASLMEEQGCGSSVGLATSLLPIPSWYLCHKWQVLKSRTPTTRKRVYARMCVSSRFPVSRQRGNGCF